MTRVCTRCHGLLTIESIPRRRHAALLLLACMACGDRVDATILANRRGMVRQESQSWKERVWARIQLLTAHAQVSA